VSTDVLHEAITSAKYSTAPMELLVENGSFQETYKLNYHMENAIHISSVTTPNRMRSAL